PQPAAGPEDEHRVVGADSAPGHKEVPRRGKDHRRCRRLHEVDLVRNRHDAPFRDQDVLGVSPVSVYAEELVRLAEVLLPIETRIAFAATDPRDANDPIPRTDRVHPGPDVDHLAGRFSAGDERQTNAGKTRLPLSDNDI